MSLTTAVLINRKETNKHNVVMAFGALRRNNAQEKLEKSYKTLENGEKVKAVEASNEIKRT